MSEPKAKPAVVLPRIVEHVTVDALSIRYVASKKDDAETIILFSPWPESLYAWNQVWPVLAGTYSLVGVDLPGFGQSEGRADLMGPKKMGSFVLKIVGALGLESSHAVGPDVGTAALLFAAAEDPEAFKSITVGGGAAWFPTQAQGLLKQFIEAPNLDEFQAANPAEIVGGAARGITGYDIPDFIVDDYVQSYAGSRFVESIEYVRSYPTDLPILIDLLAGLETPVQFLAARNDPYLLMSDPEHLSAALPNAKLVPLENGHNAWEESPSTYAAEIATWVRENHVSP